MSRFCSRPFQFLTIDNDASARICCDDWLTLPIGDMLSEDVKHVWNSEAAQQIRESIHNGSFRYCNKDVCPDLVAGTLPTKDEVRDERLRAVIDKKQTRLESLPTIVNLAYDATCNLKCPTCRDHVIVVKGPALERAYQLRDVVQRDLLASARHVIVTGYGDAFASKVHRSFLEGLELCRYPELKLTLMTNGLMFDRGMWARLEGLHGGAVAMSVSIDASTPETYQVNRGGSFSKLLRNLAFMAQLRATKELRWLEFSFVVQLNNFREMVRFVELAAAHGCDSVLFQQIVHWGGTFSAKEFAKRAIHIVSHPEHGAFVECLTDPIFDAAIVDLGNLARLRRI
jgi:sulfatase maturation enzyme AslB (radical SAM superfamily)